MENKSYFGACDCGADLDAVWFTEEEKDRDGWPTGRVRQAVDYLVCPLCGKKYVVDSSFDKEWEDSLNKCFR